MENESERVRLHVGGLGENVTSDDLSNLFSKIGFVFESVQIIRTKGRSFAYIDFLPSSLHSLSKLFTTYNGCAWKGGRLRLEKAKEHYLDLLKREWAEDAALAASASRNNADGDADTKMESAQKTKKDFSDKPQLRIFFPKLQKLKSIPFSGTGKHKYSFRRVEVPSLPKHFCDCEEHSGSFYAAKEPVLEQDGVMKQDELDMMYFVMNRLFGKENLSGALYSDVEPKKDDDISMQATDDPQFDEIKEDSSTEDEDDIILNVVSRPKKRTLTKQDLKLNKRKASKEIPEKVSGARPSDVELNKDGDLSMQATDDSRFDEIEGDSTEDEDDLIINVVGRPRKRTLTKQDSNLNKRKASKEIPENVSGTPHSDVRLNKDDDISLQATDLPQFDEIEEDSTGDEDGLIMNMVSRPKQRTVAKQDSKLNKRKASEEIPDQGVLKKKRKNQGENDVNEYASAIPHVKGSLQASSSGLGKLSGDQCIKSQSTVNKSASGVSRSQRSSWKELVGDKSNSAVNIFEILSSNISDGKEETDAKIDSNGENKKSLERENQRCQLEKPEAEKLGEAEGSKSDIASGKPGRGSAWLHKASWTQLVNSNNSCSFSISQILPGVKFDAQEPVNSEVIANPEDGKHSSKVEIAEGLSSVHITMDDNNASTLLQDKNNSATESEGSGALPASETCQSMGTRESTDTFPLVENKNNVAPKRKINRVGEAQPFMRTEESVKEWANIRAALAGSRKTTSKKKEQ